MYDETTIPLWTAHPSTRPSTSFGPNTDLPLTIGASTSGGTNWGYFLQGAVDEVATYDHALSRSRIQAHYDADQVCGPVAGGAESR